MSEKTVIKIDELNPEGTVAKMSRLNKALERIKERESSQSNPAYSSVGGRNRLPEERLKAPVDDPIQKPLRKVVLDMDVMHKNHLVTPELDPIARTSYKMLRTRVLKSLIANSWQGLAITSASQGDGKTITAINLAISLAGDVNHNVCLVDLDLRHSSIARYLGIDAQHGISDCLANNIPLEKAIVRTNIDRLTVLPNVHQIFHSSELLSSPAMSEIASALTSDPQRIVIYDMPPLLAADDMLAFDKSTDAILFVISEGITRRTDAIKARELMAELNVIGTVLNRSDEKTAAYY